jgi:ankyrin repeat protein
VCFINCNLYRYDGDGRTALMMAANNGFKEACQELLDAGCNYKVKCDRGKTAADYAQKKGFVELAVGQLYTS